MYTDTTRTEEIGNWGWHSAPPLSARARRPVALHALDACGGLIGHLHRKPGRQLLLLLLLLRLATT